MIAWLALAATAQEPAPYEITVWGDLAVQKARDDVVSAIEDHGYVVVRREEGRTVFKGRPRWKGSITLSDDGALAFGRPVVALAPLPAEIYTQDPRYEDLTRPDPLLSQAAPCPATDATCGGEVLLGPVPLVTMNVAPSKRKLQTGWDAVERDVSDEIETWLAIRRRTVFEENLLGLPDRLDALWADGTPLDGSATPATPAARRRAVLEYWASRTDTPEGNRTAEAVEDWLAAVVEPGEHPITPEERAEFGPRRPDRPLP